MLRGGGEGKEGRGGEGGEGRGGCAHRGQPLSPAAWRSPGSHLPAGTRPSGGR